jgi:hypothetical protein
MGYHLGTTISYSSIFIPKEPSMKNALKSSLALALVLLASAAAAHATPGPVPEIDANVGIGALTLIAGATAVLRSRKR